MTGNVLFVYLRPNYSIMYRKWKDLMFYLHNITYINAQLTTQKPVSSENQNNNFLCLYHCSSLVLSYLNTNWVYDYNIMIHVFVPQQEFYIECNIIHKVVRYSISKILFLYCLTG